MLVCTHRELKDRGLVSSSRTSPLRRTSRVEAKVQIEPVKAGSHGSVLSLYQLFVYSKAKECRENRSLVLFYILRREYHYSRIVFKLDNFVLSL